MKTTGRAALLLFGITALFGVQAAFAGALSLIPQPARTQTSDGVFRLSKDTTILVDTNTRALGDYLAEMFSRSTGFPCPIRQSSPEDAAMRHGVALFLLPETRDLGEEGYRLSVREDGVSIRSGTTAGIFYGIQTLRQLLPSAIEETHLPGKETEWSVPCVEIEDKPQFSWRGLMMDCSRTFWSKEYIKRTIRLMSLYKLNRLHLHLTDDQGWRLEIKKHPRLTEVGSRFAERYKEPSERQGFYTQSDIREIVEYGKRYHVAIVPEIEMPGHSLALLACYPELSCNGGPFEIHPFFKGPVIHEDILCAGNEKTFQVLEDVLSEVVELFPFAFVHVGGDEVPKERWKACSKCQARLKAEGLRDEQELQSYFTKRIGAFLNAKGKRLIGWEEILEGGSVSNAAAMVWHETGKEATIAKAGHDVVMSPTSHFYFDYDYKSISTMRTYFFDCAPEGWSRGQTGHMLGAQANFWSQIDRIETGVDRQLFPRLLSLAEVTWSPRDRRDPNSFRIRVSSHLERLKALGVAYYDDPSVRAEDLVQAARGPDGE
jgi:hexosaminidase